MNNAKPFNISKQEVYAAYKQVKANKGAAGVDRQSIEDFDKRLGGNLYKLWNRMSSGSYFPPPVRRVEVIGEAEDGMEEIRLVKELARHAGRRRLGCGAGNMRI